MEAKALVMLLAVGSLVRINVWGSDCRASLLCRNNTHIKPLWSDISFDVGEYQWTPKELLHHSSTLRRKNQHLHEAFRATIDSRNGSTPESTASKWSNILEKFGLKACPEKCNNKTVVGDKWCIREDCICNESMIVRKRYGHEREADCLVPIAGNCIAICERMLANMSEIFESNEFSNASVLARTTDYNSEKNATYLVGCECEKDGGNGFPSTFGWKVIQRRNSKRSNFTKSIADYENGFFDHTGFWTGLKKLVHFTRYGSKLQIEMGKKVNGVMQFEYIRYSFFHVSNSRKIFSMLAEPRNRSDSLNHLDPSFVSPQFSIDEKTKSGWWHVSNQTNPNGKEILWGNKVYDAFQMKILPAEEEVPSFENCSSACKDAFDEHAGHASEILPIVRNIVEDGNNNIQLCRCVEWKEWEEDLLADGWTIASNGLAYVLSSDKKSYYTAKTACAGKGARLASTGIRNGTEKSVLGELFINVFKNKTATTWVGLRGKKLASSGYAGSKWSDGVDFSNEHTPWMTGQPNGKDGQWNCLRISIVFSDKIRLNDLNCDYRSRYLCEKMCSSCTM